MVKNDHIGLEINWIMSSICALIYGVLFLVMLDGSPRGNLGFYLFLLVYWVALAIFSFVRAHRWKPMNYRRQIAATWGFASRVPLAAAHPLPNVGALPLPFIIMLRPNWPKFLLGLGILGGAALFILVSFFFLNIGYEASFPDSITAFFTLFMLLAVSSLILLWLRPQRIEVSQEGLTVRHATGGFYGTHTIRWREARLFAIRDGKPGTPGTRYELSSPYAVVQWTRTRGSHWALHRPAIPFAEYDAQMEALIALISGVTGLPLYDVR